MNNRTVVITGQDFDRLKGLIHSRNTRMMYGSMASNLADELGRGEVVSPTHVPRGVVTMNSRVRIRDTRTDDREEITVVYPSDANIDEGRISILAPLGTALLGAKVGDVVEVQAPAGVRKIKVERILYQPEAAGDFHL